MKKSLFMLGLAVAAMTSCTNDEMVDVKQPTQHAIGFESFVNKGTRAVTETTSDITKFYAFGYYDDGNPETEIVFDGTTVSRADASATDWTYDLDANTADNQLAYWTKNVYQFAGYANGNATDALTGVTFKAEGTDTKTATLKFAGYTVADDNDLVAGLTSVDNKSADKSGDKVNFTFSHLLTKVKFKVINNDTKYKMRITSPLTITGVNTKGDCTVISTGATWSNQSTEKTGFVPVTVTTADTYIPITTDNSVESEEYFVLPQTLTDAVNFSITAEFYDENNQLVSTKTLTNKTIVANNNAETPVSVSAWVPGYTYNYTISLPTSVKPIVFGAPTIGGWEQGGTIELNPNDSEAND